LPEAVRASQVVFIAVGTPPNENGDCDLSYVEAVAHEVAACTAGYKLIVQKSTVPVRTAEWVRKVMLRNGAAMGSFEVASNPEFLREGSAVLDFLYPDRIVIGTSSMRAANMLQSLYRPLTDGSYIASGHSIGEPEPGVPVPARLIVTSTSSAELIKHASNAFLASKISFINAVANICESVGANVEEVCKGMGSDLRIGHRFLRPGIGFGGSCFPKDLKAFRAVAHDCGYRFGMLDEVLRINDEQCVRFLSKVRNALWTLKGKHIAALGLAFKGGTDDIRESPALRVIQELAREGCVIHAYDPAAMDKAGPHLPPNVSLAEDAYSAARDAHALLVLTDWPEFADLDLPRLRSELTYPIVIDGRNMLDPQTMSDYGFSYSSVGRPESSPSDGLAEVAQAAQHAG
jgi:UDPglucose 6-dehydrogenase